jgi:hypothetical protein
LPKMVLETFDVGDSSAIITTDKRSLK